MSIKFHGYWLSSASYRIRIASNLKQMELDYCPVNMSQKEHTKDAYRNMTPQGMVPCFELEDGTIISQSMAMMEYLEDIKPTPSLFPADSARRARARNMAMMLACEAGVNQSVAVQNYLKSEFDLSETQVGTWLYKWLAKTIGAIETMVETDPSRGDFCIAGRPTIVECLLIPQLANARRFNVDLSEFKTISKIEAACAELPEFQKALPENQKDYPG